MSLTPTKNQCSVFQFAKSINLYYFFDCVYVLAFQGLTKFFSFDLVNSCSKIEKDDKSAGEESDISDDDTGKRRFPIGSAGKY